MGYETVIWTPDWDTNEWKMSQHFVKESELVEHFKDALAKRDKIQSPSCGPGGSVTLQHDLNTETIRLSMKLIRKGMARGLKPTRIAHCLGENTPYQRGSKLGPNGAAEKILDLHGESVSCQGVEGMAEQDFRPKLVKELDASAKKSSADSEDESIGGTSHAHGVGSRSRMKTSIYPTKDELPDVNSPQVRAWVAQIDWSKVPKIPVAAPLPNVPNFPKCPPVNLVDRSSCWWSCSGCVAKDDVVTCPSQTSWGLTYDDGPSLATRDMMHYLGEKKLTATFFIVGSRVLDFPDILKEQVAQGHHIAMHRLTTLTNEQIVAEIRWTEKIIRDVTGLTMKYVRPPYGDTDNRVREILRQMGYTTVIWTEGWDTNDWRMLQNQIQAPEVIQNFQKALSQRASIKSASGQVGRGPITLEHDLSEATISLSKSLIPMAQANGLTPMSIAACLGDLRPYQRGSTLGPHGAKEKADGGEGTSSFKGMVGMSEQDFKSTIPENDLLAASGRRSAAATESPSMTMMSKAIVAMTAMLAVTIMALL
ncbi:chitin deacetylase [Gryganskiella cystojenkinii]|nr:chitin deacetylase [Gryganskiella cystojenkinii]